MSERALEFGTAKAGPGEKGNGFIKVAEFCDGSPLNTPVIILNGMNPGPKLLIYALEDGDEYPGALGVLEVVNRVLPSMLNKMNGSVVCLPATNIGAFRGNPFGGGQRMSPLNIEQAGRIHRLYPGDPDGRHTQQVAHHIHNVLKEYDPDVHIRMHGCKQIYGWDRILVSKSPPGSKLDMLVRSAVTKKDEMAIVAQDREAPKRPLEFSLETNGGENGTGNGLNTSAMREGILNAMRHLRMIPGEELKVDKIQYLRSLGIMIHSRRGGFFTPLVNIKDLVKEGQKIGEIRNFFDDVVEEIKSPADGMIVGYYCEAPHIGSGQWRIFELFAPTEYR